MPEDKKQTNWDKASNPQDRTARIDALWTKLQNRENTKFMTNTDGKKADTPMQKELLLRENIKKYKDANLSNNINSLGVGLKVDKNFAKLSNKDTKVLEASSKALEALADVPLANPNKRNPYQKVDRYLSRIDNIDKPGLAKQAIKAASNLGSDLIKKLANHLPSRQNNPNKGKGKDERGR